MIENANEGTDAVFANIAYTLAAQRRDPGAAGRGQHQRHRQHDRQQACSATTGDNTLDGGGAADVLTGGVGNDTFVFHAGEANGDMITDFAGNGAAAGKTLTFVGFGPSATFTNVDATHWQVSYAGGAAHELITFMNGAAVDHTDVLFA